MADLDHTSLDFGSVLRAVDKGLKIKPILQNYLTDAKFPPFDVHFEAGDGYRQPDGWFHPSQHPLLPDRWLYYYLSDPFSMTQQSVPYMQRLSMTMGTAVHGFFDMCLKDAGATKVRTEPCICGNPECTEWGFEDAECGERGHADGMTFEDEIFELKTATELSSKVRKAEDNDLEYFKANWYGYWAQQQSYLRMSGCRTSRLVFFTLGYPWEMREFAIPFDPHFSYQVSEKYRRVRQAVADHRRPVQCCGGKKACESRRLCLA